MDGNASEEEEDQENEDCIHSEEGLTRTKNTIKMSKEDDDSTDITVIDSGIIKNYHTKLNSILLNTLMDRPRKRKKDYYAQRNTAPAHRRPNQI